MNTTSLSDWKSTKEELKVSDEEFKSAVEHLYPIALGSSEQNLAARSVLLSAYDGEEYPIRIPELQKLHLGELDACLVIIRACVLNQVEPHILIENGMDRFHQLVLRHDQPNK